MADRFFIWLSFTEEPAPQDACAVEEAAIADLYGTCIRVARTRQAQNLEVHNGSGRLSLGNLAISDHIAYGMDFRLDDLTSA